VESPQVPDARPEFSWQDWRPVPKFQHNYGKHILLFLATLVTTDMAGATWPYPSIEGLWYAIPILLILSAHEFGHYFACRIHDVDATLPYYLPVPLPLTGTIGAVIKIREAFPSKRALFDIGVAGPIAGFVALIPFLIWGVGQSEVVKLEPERYPIMLGEPLLLKLVSHLTWGPMPAGYDLIIHPTAFAAWFGMLATALNLLPFGQLDGGHISYSAFGHKARYVSMATLAIALGLTIVSSSWLVTAIMMTAMAVFLGFGHPRIIDEHEPLDAKRTAIAILAVVIFVICFTPVPIETLF
jgi:membrane-associated protease RseP (regulator of RpoE activity)